MSLLDKTFLRSHVFEISEKLQNATLTVQHRTRVINIEGYIPIPLGFFRCNVSSIIDDHDFTEEEGNAINDILKHIQKFYTGSDNGIPDIPLTILQRIGRCSNRCFCTTSIQILTAEIQNMLMDQLAYTGRG